MKIENCSVFDRNEYENIMEAIRTRKTNSHPIYSYIDDKEANTIMAVIQNLLEDSVPLEEVQPEVIMHSPHKEEAIYLLKKLQTTFRSEANTIMAVIQNLLEDSVPLEEVQPEVIMHSPHKEEAIYLLKKLQTTYLHDVDSEGEPKMSIIELRSEERR